MTDSAKERPKSLRSDEGGAIMVVGVFMAIVMGAAIFYVIGTGEAIIYRERVQDGADAVAFTAASIHARGMNIIVLLNMIMLALVTVLVALKTIQLVNNIVLPLAIAGCPWTGIACVYIPIGTAIRSVLAATIPVYENAIMRPALFALSTAQTGIAIGTPWVSLAKGKNVAKEYTPLVTNSMVVSPSMVPWLPPGKLGLPVKYGEYKDLCKKAGENIEHIFFFLPGPVKWAIGKAGGMVTSSFSGYFCGDLGAKGGGGFGQLSDLLPSIDDLMADVTAGCKDKHGDDAAAVSQCEADGKKKVEDGIKDSEEDLTSQQTLSGGAQKSAKFGGKVFNFIAHKELIDGAKMGGGHFQVWGITIGDEAWPRSVDKGVAIAGKAGVKPPTSSWGKYRIAQGEFFWDTSGKVDNDETVWERRWTARLRRVKPTLPELGAGFGKWGMGKLLEKFGISTMLEKALTTSDDSPLSFLTGDWVKGKITKALKGLAGGLGGVLDNRIAKYLTAPEMIH